MNLHTTYVAIQMKLLETISNHADGQSSTIDRWRSNILNKVGNGPHVVEVAVRNDDTFQLSLVLLEIACVGNDKINAGHALGWEHDTHIDHDGIVAVFNDHHISAKLSDSSEG